MKIGFLGFGEVASTLTNGLLNQGADVYTCVEGRSIKTKQIAKETGVTLCKSNKELAKTSDILISSVTPVQAIKIAQEVGKHSKGVYVDINNISPKTIKKTMSFIQNNKTVDAAIIGSVRQGLDVQIIASGKYAKEFMELNQYGMNITIVGMELGQASAIKMLRSSFTKGISALLFETIYSAYKMGIDEEVIKYIAKTECEGFKDSATSRIISSAVHAKRRYEEMDEVTELISENLDPKMSNATQDFFKSLYENINKLEKRPDSYIDLFKIMEDLNKK
ncbi:MAG: NAD(P)-dependent oxidoreductase [Methanobacterium sp.]|uniref:DUF1932 domain-containing protein n=1 Tax=Methanobacterium sp. TaxID=2164 RepID=UPI003D6476AA|nr:NAD(P)-dependent oxidoreductase [Methanobacterium sp.]